MNSKLTTFYKLLYCMTIKTLRDATSYCVIVSNVDFRERTKADQLTASRVCKKPNDDRLSKSEA